MPEEHLRLTPKAPRIGPRLRPVQGPQGRAAPRVMVCAPQRRAIATAHTVRVQYTASICGRASAKAACGWQGRSAPMSVPARPLRSSSP